jgi:hypothetical protein
VPCLPQCENVGPKTKRRPPIEAASKFLLVAIPAPVMVVARIVAVVAMMVAVVAMMVAVIAMMIVVMMVAVPGCSWNRVADSDCADNA